MDNIEKELSKKLANIKPTKKLFEEVISSRVTKEKVYRYNTKRASKLSFYQLINNNFFMKKGLLIGLPALAFVFIVVLFVTKSPDEVMPIANNYTPSLTIDESNDVNNVIEDNSSIDSIIASFNKDADNDLLSAQSEEEDIDFIMADLEDFNSLKTNSYEDTI